MEPFLVSAAVVGLAEIGDKTQLLVLMLAARYRRPWAIAAGILMATLLSNALAGALGVWITWTLPPGLLRWLVGGAFLAMALWVLVPEGDGVDGKPIVRRGVFLTTFATFLLSEMGDKTQLATVALAAHFEVLAAVVLGATLGMLLANLPALWLGDRLAHRVPAWAVRLVAATVLALLGVLALSGAGERWGL